MKNTIGREMSITHKEFFRLLPNAVNGLPCRMSGNHIHLREDSRSIRISLEKETTRIIASLTLPVTRLTIEFSGYEGEDVAGFLKRFDLVYQKGGG